MSLSTCTACSARYSVDAPACPQCGATQHEDGDTISGETGVQGARHIPQAYADAAPAAPVIPAQTTPGATLTIIPEVPAPVTDAPPEASTGG